MDTVRKYDEALHQKFGLSNSERPIGVLFSTDSLTIIMEVATAEKGEVPVLVSYNAFGYKTDSLHLYIKTGWDVGYQAIEYLRIMAFNKIMVIDSVATFELDSLGANEVAGTRKHTVDTTFYGFSVKGKFGANQNIDVEEKVETIL